MPRRGWSSIRPPRLVISRVLYRAVSDAQPALAHVRRRGSASKRVRRGDLNPVAHLKPLKDVRAVRSTVFTLITRPARDLADGVPRTPER
jgi:hypothetical protein